MASCSAVYCKSLYKFLPGKLEAMDTTDDVENVRHKDKQKLKPDLSKMVNTLEHYVRLQGSYNQPSHPRHRMHMLTMDNSISFWKTCSHGLTFSFELATKHPSPMQRSNKGSGTSITIFRVLEWTM